MNSLQCCTTTQSLPWPSTTSVSFSKWSGSCVGYWNTPRAISSWGEPTCLRCKRRGVGVKVADVIKWEANWDVHLWYLSVMWGFLRGFVSFGYANTTVSTHRLERKKKKKSQMLTRGISNVTNFNGKWWKNTRKARLDCPLWSLWILGEFFLSCIIRTVSVEKQIAISVNQTGDNAVCHK